MTRENPLWLELQAAFALMMAARDCWRLHTLPGRCSPVVERGLFLAYMTQYGQWLTALNAYSGKL